MASFSKGFTEARKTAARKIKKIKEEAGEDFEFTDVHTAWEIYEPCAYSDNGSHYERVPEKDPTNASKNCKSPKKPLKQKFHSDPGAKRRSFLRVNYSVTSAASNSKALIPRVPKLLLVSLAPFIKAR